MLLRSYKFVVARSDGTKREGDRSLQDPGFQRVVPVPAVLTPPGNFIAM